MADLSPIQRIRDRKEWLKATSELRRCMIALDGRELSGKLHWVDRGFSAMRWLRPAVPVALGIAGVLAVRRLKGTLSLAGKAVVGYQIARSFLRRASVAAPSKARD